MTDNIRQASFRLQSISYLGYGFWEAWSMLCYVDNSLDRSGVMASAISLTGQSITSMIFLICSLSLTATIFLLAILKCTDRWSQHPWFPSLGGILCACGTIGIVIAGTFFSSAVEMFYVSCAISGIGSGILCLSYAPIIGIQPPTKSFMQVCYCMILCCLIYFIAASAPYQIKWVICVGCPIVSAILAIFGQKGGIVPDDAQKLSLTSSAWRFFITVFILAAAASLIRVPLFSMSRTGNGNEWLGWGSFAVLVVCIALVLVCKQERRTYNVAYLYYPLSIIVIVFLLVIGFKSSDVSITLASLSAAPRSLLNVVFDAIFFYIIFQSKMSPAKIMGLGHGFKSLGILLGGELESLAGLLWDSGDTDVHLVFYIMVAFCVMIGIVMITPDRTLNSILVPIDDQDADGAGLNDSSRTRSDQESDNPDASEESSSDQNAEQPGRRKLWTYRCDSVAETYLLSPREREVLYLLSLGHGSEYISQKLVISLYTARTHTRNIYSKTNVHSREELIRLVKTTKVEDDIDTEGPND